MNQQRQLRPGEYTTLRATDTKANRLDAEHCLRKNGCKSVRFEPLPDGRLLAHGYMAADMVFPS